jgi:hypothetical protein
LLQGTEGHDSSSPSDSKSAWAKLTETWTFEFGGFVAALACLAATVALLSHYNNEPNPAWPVTLNFVLSLLGNAASASTLLADQASVAQTKRIWYVKRPRPMADLATFQNARGGLVGAVQLPFAVGAQ